MTFDEELSEAIRQSDTRPQCKECGAKSWILYQDLCYVCKKEALKKIQPFIDEQRRQIGV